MITKEIITGRIQAEIWESDKKYVDQISQDESFELAEIIASGVVSLLTQYGESAENLFNGDIRPDEQCEAVVIDDLLNQE